MNQISVDRRGKRRVLSGILLALLCALLQPWALIFQMMMPMAGIGYFVILAVALYGWGGMLPAACMCVAAILWQMLSLGPAIGGIVLPMTLLPAGIIIWGIRRKDPFFQQMKRALLALLLGTTLSIVLAGLVYGGNMVADFVGIFSEFFEENREPLLEQVRMMSGYGNSVTMEMFTEAYQEVFKSLRTYYEYNLLANLFSGALWTAAIAVLLGNWQMARKGEATTESFKGISEWYLPSNVTIGLLLMLAVSAILLNFSISGNVTLYLIVSALNLTAFAIQGFAANDRRLRKRGSGRSRRVSIVILILLAEAVFGTALLGVDALTVMACVGGLSALFGEKGAARPMIDHIKEKLNENDED